MFEAVGERWWPAYFRAVRNALKPGGRACIQTITIADERFERYRADPTSSSSTSSPAACSPRRRASREARAAGLDVDACSRFGRDYAETLKRWLAAFDAEVDAVRAQGFAERFIRCWRFYLAYCAAGFASGTTDVAHYTLVAAERCSPSRWPRCAGRAPSTGAGAESTRRPSPRSLPQAPGRRAAAR